MLPANAYIIKRWQDVARVTQPRVTEYVGRYPVYNVFVRLYARYHTLDALIRFALRVAIQTYVLSRKEEHLS